MFESAYRVVFGLLVGAILLVAAAMSVGRMLRPLPVALLSLQTCQLPCWSHLVPHETSLGEAEAALTNAGYVLVERYRRERFAVYAPPDSSACTVDLHYSGSYTPRANIGAIGLKNCGDIAVGDLSLILGSPDGLLPTLTGISFDRGFMQASFAPMDPCTDWISPYTRLSTLYIDAPVSRNGTRFAIALDELVDWEGFTRRAWYNGARC